MQIKTGIPLDLLVFIQALVIMFVAAPGLIRALYRFDRAEVAERRRRGPPVNPRADAGEGSAA